MKNILTSLLALVLGFVSVFTGSMVTSGTIMVVEEWNPVIKFIIYFAIIGWILPLIPCILIGYLFSKINKSVTAKRLLGTSAVITAIWIATLYFQNINGLDFTYAMMTTFFSIGATIIPSE